MFLFVSKEREMGGTGGGGIEGGRFAAHQAKKSVNISEIARSFLKKKKKLKSKHWLPFIQS